MCPWMKIFPVSYYKMTECNVCVAGGWQGCWSLPITQQVLGQLLIFLAVKLSSCIVLEWNSAPTGVSAHHHLSLHPPPGSFNCSLMENVGAMNLMPERRPEVLKFLYKCFKSKETQLWATSDQMFVNLKSEPVFACFILRGSKHSHVPKLMKHFHINVRQRRISSNFDLSLILNQEAFCVLELWHGSTLFLCSISSYLTTRSPPEWC